MMLTKGVPLSANRCLGMSKWQIVWNELRNSIHIGSHQSYNLYSLSIALIRSKDSNITSRWRIGKTKQIKDPYMEWPSYK